MLPEKFDGIGNFEKWIGHFESITATDGPAGDNKPIKKFPAHGNVIQHIVSLHNNPTSAIAYQLVNIW